MTSPPRLIERILASLGAEPRFLDGVLGDLAESANPAFHPPRWYAVYVPILVMLAATAGGVTRVARSGVSTSARVDSAT